MLKVTSTSSKFFLVALAASLVFLGNLKYQQWRKQQAIEQEKQALQQQTHDLEKKKGELSASLSYLNNPAFREKIAREQLGLKKSGELVFSYPENIYISDSRQPGQKTKPKPNYLKWWEYFIDK